MLLELLDGGIVICPTDAVFLNRDETTRLRAEELKLPESVEAEIDAMLSAPWRFGEESREYVHAVCSVDSMRMKFGSWTSSGYHARVKERLDEDIVSRAIPALYGSGGAGWDISANTDVESHVLIESEKGRDGSPFIGNAYVTRFVFRRPLMPD